MREGVPPKARKSMFEKVNPSHPDKISDRIAGAIVDRAYKHNVIPKIAVEVLVGHGECHVMTESSCKFEFSEIQGIVHRIAGEDVILDLMQNQQDKHLADNQKARVKCGDNGIFKGVRTNNEEKRLTEIVKELYREYPYDGKYIYDERRDLLIACQSNVKTEEFTERLKKFDIKNIIVNPLGDWTGGINVDTGATNRKLGSDMGRAVTGGGVNGKDLSKADVSVNIYLHLITQNTPYDNVESECAIGDESILVMGEAVPYNLIVQEAGHYISEIGGFEKFAEWGLIR